MGRHVELPEQVREELPEHGLGVPGVLELAGAEAEYLVPGELELAVAAGALGVHGGVRAAAGAVVGGAVDFQDDPRGGLAMPAGSREWVHFNTPGWGHDKAP